MRRIFNSMAVALCWAMVLAAATRVSAGLVHGAATQQVALLSDIHFDPFPPGQTCDAASARGQMAALMAKPATRWSREDFAAQKTASGLGADTNYFLMASALRAAAAAAPDAHAVLIAGDFLAHHFHDRFKLCEPGASEAAFTEFAIKTVEFVTLEVGRAFPDAQLLPTLGNNDTDMGDYTLPSPAMLAALGRFWLRTVGSEAVLQEPHADFGHFGQGGYFAVDIAGWHRVRLISLNSVVWSAKFSAPGKDPTGLGNAELAWLQAALQQAHQAGERVVLLGHVPPGLDAYATRQAHGTQIVGMYRECKAAQPDCTDDSRALSAMLQRFHTTVAMAIFGHTHQNEFRVLGEGANAVPLKVVPAISPVFRDNPAFLVARVTPQFGFADYQAWNLPLSAGKSAWEREFDFDREYSQPAWNAATLQSVATKLKQDNALRQSYFLEMSSGNAEVSVPTRWQDAYLCGQVHMTAETVLPCVAESQLGLPLP